MKCGVENVEFRLESVKCGAWSVWRVKCEVWSVKCKVWSVKCGVGSVECGV